MSDDFVKQLRDWREADGISDDARRKFFLMKKAANRIEQLEAVLRDVLLWSNHCAACDYDDDWEKIETHARAALGEKKDD